MEGLSAPLPHHSTKPGPCHQGRAAAWQEILRRRFEFDQRFGTLLEAGQGFQQLSFLPLIDLCQQFGPPGTYGRKERKAVSNSSSGMWRM